jgi:hypothetical protein
MNSLQDLNGYGQTSITITDDRFATVIFNRMPPLQARDVEQDIVTTTVAVTPGIEITDIINYSTANVRYQVEISSRDGLLTASSLTWPTLPAYMSVGTVGLVYTVSGFRTASDWNTARAFTWTLPADFATAYPKFWLDIKIIYFDEELGADVEKDFAFYDLRYYEVADLQVVASMNTIPTHYKSTECDLQSAFTLFGAGGEEIQLIPTNLSASASISVNGQVTQRAALTAQFTLNALVGEITQINFVGTAVFTQVTNSAVYKAINLMNNRSYTSNTQNVIFTAFGAQAPFIEEIPGSTSTYEVTLTSTEGEWGTTADIYTAASSITFTGSRTQVNTWFETVTWYPVKNNTGTVSATYTQKKDGVLQITKNFNLEFAASGTITDQLYTFETAFNAGLGDFTTYTWTPTLAERKYTVMDYLIVGGGEDGVGFGSFDTGSGGRGGQVISATGQTISNTSYTVNVGASGEGTGSRNSSFAGQTAVTAYSGGFANGTDASLSTKTAFGGGSGAGGAGQNGSVTGTGPYVIEGGDGGAGVANSITGTSRLYAPGGGGGFSGAVSADTASRGTDGTGFPTVRYGGGGQGQSQTSPNTFGGGDPGRSGVVFVKTRA